MATKRLDMLGAGSTNEDDALTSKYNHYKRNLLSSGSLTNHSNFSTSARIISPMSQKLKNENNDFLLSNVFPEHDNDSDNFTILKKAYEDRLLNLSTNFRMIINKIQNDNLLNTIRSDPITGNNTIANESVNNRLKEIIEQNLFNEKEDMIARLNEANADLQSKLEQWMNNNTMMNNDYVNKLKIFTEDQEEKIQHLELLLSEAYQKNQMLINDISSLKVSMQSIQEEYELEIKKLNDEFMMRLTKANNECQKYKTENNNLKETANYFESQFNAIKSDFAENKLEMERLQKVISVLEIDLNSSESSIKEKSSKCEKIQFEQSSLQAQIFEANLKSKKLSEENKSLQSLIEHYEEERKEMMNKYSSFNKDIQSSHNDKIQSYENINYSLQQQIDDLKVANADLAGELQSEKNKTIKEKVQYSKIYSDMQVNASDISSQWEKRFKEDQREYDKIISELENKHELQMNNMRHDYCIEIENLNRELMKYRQEAAGKSNVKIGMDCISIEEHEAMVNSAMNSMRNKYENEMRIKCAELENEYYHRMQKENSNRIVYELNEVKQRNLALENALQVKENTIELIKRTLKNKLSSIQAEIASIKSYYINQLTQLKKDQAATIDILSNKIRQFLIAFDNEVEFQVQRKVSACEKEYKLKFEDKDLESANDIKKMQERFDKHILDQFKLNEKLEKENQNLLEIQERSLVENKQLRLKLNEIEQENKLLRIQMGQLHDKSQIEREENIGKEKKDCLIRLQNSITSIFSILVRMKKKYSQEILKLKGEVEDLNRAYEGIID